VTPAPAAVSFTATTADPAWPEDAVEVGRIVDAWGIKGWIKVLPFCSDPQALFSSRRWFLKPPEAPGVPCPGATATTWPALLKVTEAREHGGVVVAQVQDVTDRGGAEALRGGRLYVGRSSFPAAADDEFYWVDLIGLSVVNRQGDALGTVSGLLDTGPHSVLQVTSTDGVERLVPFVAAYVDDVSLPARRITVDWGLNF
jgi:16S rRNA processing protein RimM